MTWSVWPLIAPTNITRTVAVLSAAILAMGCTVYTHTLNYKDVHADVRLDGGHGRGQPLGYVTGESGGYIWSGCESRTALSLKELAENAKALGADEVGDIVWDSTGSAQPGCRRGWVYAAAWPFLFTPIFMNTRVEGMAYKTR